METESYILGKAELNPPWAMWELNPVRLIQVILVLLQPAFAWRYETKQSPYEYY